MDQGGIGFLVDPSKFPIIGEVSFACSSTEYLWQVPSGITSITAVCIGGGGGGHAGNNQNQGAGGGGGALRWINGMPVVPGETLRVKAGLGGTGAPTEVLALGLRPGGNNANQITWGRPGAYSYIASDNNASVPARSGIGDTIIVVAQGGGWDNYLTDIIRYREGTTTQASELNMQNPDINATNGVGQSGGQGSAFGSFDWGTIGGGNGGDGGQGDGVGGGQDGGGGGAGGWFGNGGLGGFAENTPNGTPTDGAGGGGGGGMFGGGGGADASGGGGGVGVFWGNGPNGKSGYYFFRSGNIEEVVAGSGGAPAKSHSASGFGGQGGSFGADARATGTEIINETAYFVGGVSPVTNHFNNSNGNGKRGYNGPTDDDISQPFVIPNGGDYGGGGGAAQTAGGDNDTPISGDGGCGHVRILFVARNPFIIREYGGERTVGTGAADETRTINGESVTVRFRDFDPSLSIPDNLAAGWPAWNPTPQTGIYYNLLVNYAFNVPSINQGFLPAAVGISTIQYP